MKTRIAIFITLLCSITVNAQIKTTFFENELVSNSIELGVALKNFWGNKKFNDFLSSGKLIHLYLTMNAQGEVYDIEPISGYLEDTDMIAAGNGSLNMKKFKEYLKERNYSFTRLPMEFSDMRVFGLSMEDVIYEAVMYSYLPCTKFNVNFVPKWINLWLGMTTGKKWSMFELFNSNSPFIERGVFISKANMLDSLEVTPELYNSEIAALGFLYILGEYGFNHIMKEWNGEYTLEFNVEIDRKGFPKKITSLNTYGYNPGRILYNFNYALILNNDIFRKRLLFYFQNHHFRFKTTGNGSANREIKVKFPGKLLSLCNNTDEKPDWVSAFKVGQVAAFIYSQECQLPIDREPN